MFTARLPLEIESNIAHYAAHYGTSKTAIVIEALQDFFKQKPINDAMFDIAAKSLTLSEQLDAIQAKIAAKHPNEPDIDWREARDAGRR
jgi:hypothetical protein